MFHLLSGPLEQGLVYAIMALGVYLTFRVLDFADLTVDGSFPLGAAITASWIVGGHHPLLATGVGVLGGFLAGTVTGLLHTKGKISGLLSGILTMTGLYSVNLRVMGRSNMPLLRIDTLVTWVRGLSSSPYTLLIAFLLAALVLKVLLDLFLHTDYGLAMRATGDNEDMIRAQGVNTDGTKIIGLGLANGLVALSGGLVAQYQGFADVGMGIGMIIAGLASVIIGEVLLRPRTIFRATISVILGSIVYRLVIFMALRLGFNPSDLKLVTAVLVVLALTFPRFKLGRILGSLNPKKKEEGESC